MRWMFRKLEKHSLMGREIPIFAALSAFGYGIALTHTARALLPLIAPDWWFYLLLLVGTGIGVAMPLRRDEQGANVGRFMIGLVWLLAPSIIGSISAILHGGWTIEELLLRGVLPGVLLFGAFVMASTLGDACVLLVPQGGVEGDAQPDVEVRRSAAGFRQFMGASFKGWILLALIGSGLVNAVVGEPARVVPTLGIGLGAALGLASTLLTVHLAHMHHRQCLLQSEVEDQVVALNRARWQKVFPLIAGVTAAALLIPANISPIARQGVGGFFLWLTDRVAPLFVPGRRQRSGSSDGGFMDRLVQGLLSRFAEGDEGAEAAVSGLSLFLSALLMIVLVLACAFVIWRLVRLMRFRRSGDQSGGARYKERSIFVELIVWLWEQLRGLFKAISSWADSMVNSEGTANAKRRRRGRKERLDDVGDGGPAARIRALFARWLRQMDRLGFPRYKDETPYEYAERVIQLRPDAKTEIGQTADIYVKARYSPQQELTVLERAYHALRSSVSRALQAIRRKSADPQ